MGLFSGRSERIAYMDVQQKLEDMRKNGRDILKNAQKNSLSSLRMGYDTANEKYQDAIDLYTPYRDTGLKAFGAYADATGANGQEGYDKAVSSFRASPGYQYAVDQSTDQVARKASALGALGSGNTMAEISDRAGHMADQEYGTYLDRLNNVAQYGYNATGAQAGLTKGMGDLATQYGQDKTSLYTHIADARVANNWNATMPLVQARMGIANAGSQAAANAWGLGMNVAKAGLGFLGGNGISNLKSLFS